MADPAIDSARRKDPVGFVSHGLNQENWFENAQPFLAVRGVMMKNKNQIG